jgi:hypothetical protein
MASENAKAVAKEVLETVRKGAKVSIRKIARKHGYSNSVSDHAKKITETKTYQAEIGPVILALEEERNEIIKRLKVTRDKAKYRDLIDGMDKVTKNLQLLTGGRTENTGVGELAEQLNSWINSKK